MRKLAIHVALLCDLAITAAMLTTIALALCVISSAHGAQPLMSDEKEAFCQRFIPLHFDDRDLQAKIHDPRLIFYTDEEMPRAYQFGGSVHSPSYNIAANPDPYGNGNREFPWDRPAGTQATPEVKTIRFIWLPRQPDGKYWPVVWYQGNGVKWDFPIGTNVGEILSMPGPDGMRYVFEVRTRTRHRTEWEMDVFRPYPTPAALASRIKELRPNWGSDPTLSAAVRQLESPVRLTAMTIAEHQPNIAVFRQTAGHDYLPKLNDPKLTAQLLTEGVTYRSVAGVDWQQDGDLEAFAPDAQEFSIVPQHYLANMVEVSDKSCMRCHETAGMEVRAFSPNREWYGQISGNAGIISFHPFAASCISYNGYGRGVQFNQRLITAGVIAPYDQQVHPPSMYSTIKGLVH